MKKMAFFLLVWTGLMWQMPICLLEANEAQIDGYRIYISRNKKELTLYLGDQKIKTYPVAVPKAWIKKKYGEGKVESIIFNPWWYPTKKTRRAILEEEGVELPKKIPPGHPLNAMGKVKIGLSYTFNGVKIYRIHGTNKPWLVGRTVSRGCFRMHNNDILELTRFVKIGTLVVIE